MNQFCRAKVTPGASGCGNQCSPSEVVEKIGQWREKTGVTRIYLQVLDLSDLAHIEFFAAEITPQLD